MNEATEITIALKEQGVPVPAIAERLREHGYSEAEIDDAFDEAAERLQVQARALAAEAEIIRSRGRK